jgi:hypothetical protein
VKAYKEEVSFELVDLDEADEWIHLVSTCDGNRDKAVVTHTAARNNSAVTRYGRPLDTTLGELDREASTPCAPCRPGGQCRAGECSRGCAAVGACRREAAYPDVRVLVAPTKGAVQ